MKNDKVENREELALDALLAATLRQPEEAEVTDEEIAKFLASKTPLSEEARSVLKKIGPDVMKHLLALEGEGETENIAASEMAPLYAAMNRKNKAGQHDQKTEEELDRKRREILARLEKKQPKKGKV